MTITPEPHNTTITLDLLPPSQVYTHLNSTPQIRGRFQTAANSERIYLTPSEQGLFVHTNGPRVSRRIQRRRSPRVPSNAAHLFLTTSSSVCCRDTPLEAPVPMHVASASFTDSPNARSKTVTTAVGSDTHGVSTTPNQAALLHLFDLLFRIYRL